MVAARTAEVPIGNWGPLEECVASSDLCLQHNSRGAVEAFMGLADFRSSWVTWGGIIIYTAHSMFILRLPCLSPSPIWPPQPWKVPNSFFFFSFF